MTSRTSGERRAPVEIPINRAKRSHAEWSFRVACIEFVIVWTAAYLASLVYFKFAFGHVPSAPSYIAPSALLAVSHVLISLFDGQYNFLDNKWKLYGISRGTGSISLAFMFLLSLIFLFNVDDYSRGTFLSQIAAVWCALILTRIILAQRLQRMSVDGKIQGLALIVVSLSGNDRFGDLADKFCIAPDKIVKWYNLDVNESMLANANRNNVFAGRLSSIQKECRKLHADSVIVIYDAVNKERVVDIVEAFYELPVNVQLLPVGMIPFMQNSRICQSGRLRMLEISSGPSSFVDRAIKRAFDLVVAIVALVLLSPLFLLVAIAIKLDSLGPAIFRQTRHGFNNEPIRVFKFRTMVTIQESSVFKQATKNDPRISWVGRLLRRTNIDELPQLFNVIQGDMSIVGPRPHPIALNQIFAKEIKLMSRRHNVKPGITGWAQVNGFRGETNAPDKMRSRIEYDLYYIDNWSIFFDVKILLMTLLSSTAYSNAY